MTTPRRILIVEDEMIVQLHLKRIVEEIGHEVVGTATSMREALDAAELAPPELVMMDIHLAEGSDGVETARALCERFDCAIVFATAYADEATIERTTSVTSAGYIVKPFSAPEVRAAISTALHTHARLQSARDRERSLASVLVSMGDAVFVTNERTIVTFANPKAADLTGWTSEEACDHDLLDLLRFTGANHGKAVGEALARCMDAGESDFFPQVEITSRDGDEHTVRLDIEPLRERGSDPVGLVVTLRERGGGEAVAVAPVSRRKIPFGRGTRMVVYSHDTFGLGHLRRCLKLSRMLVARYPGINILLITGSPMVHRHAMPTGVDYMKLPAIRKVGKEHYEPRSLSMSSGGIRALRSNLLLRTIRDYDPNVLLVDHAPTGSKGELRAALDWLERRGGCTRILGLRDIIDDPSEVVPLWQERGIYDVLRDLYDHIVVYGASDVYDPVKMYELPADVAAKVRYVGYVCDTTEADDDPAPTSPSAEPYVAVTIGGGDGGAEEVIGTFLDMMARFRDRIDFRAKILTGPFVEEELDQRYRTLARSLPVEIETFIPSTAALFRGAEVVISTAGYNTTTDVLTHARRSIIIPRILHRQEQLVRARCLERIGLTKCLPPDEVTPEKLLEAIEHARSDSDGALHRLRTEGGIPLDGAARFATFCGELLVSTRIEKSEDGSH